jgi:hypothetical protein
MFSGINLYYVPELEVLLDKEKGETTDDLLELSPERILTRWMNYHLRRAGEESVTTGGMAVSTVYPIQFIFFHQGVPFMHMEAGNRKKPFNFWMKLITSS